MVGRHESPCAVQQSELLEQASSSPPQLGAQLPVPPPSPGAQENPAQQSALVMQLAACSPQAVRGSQMPDTQGPPQQAGLPAPQPWPLALHWRVGAGPGGPQKPGPLPASSHSSGAVQSAIETQLPPSPTDPQPGPASPPSGIGVAETQVLLLKLQLRPLQQFARAQSPPAPMQLPLLLPLEVPWLPLVPVELDAEPLLLA